MHRATAFFQELRQRKIVRGASLYVVVAWVIAQAAEILTDALSLPDFTLRLVVLLLALGFPLALVFSWIFDVSPQGIRLESSIEHDSAPQSNGRMFDFAIIAVLAVAVAYFGKAYFTERTSGGAALVERSIAVLPFVNLSGDPAKDYFSDGVTEELLNGLANVAGLNVVGRTSSFYFKGKDEDLRRIGEQLGVETVLEGSVRQDGDQVRITAQLVNTADGFHLWSETFDYRLDNVFAVQDDIARAVVKQLKVSLLGEAAASEAAAPPTLSSIAYQAYLRGRYELHRRVQDSIVRSTAFFREAVEADPDYADAWVGLAESYIIQHSNHRTLGREEAVRLATAAIERALLLKPESAPAHAALGLIRMTDENNDGAQAAFERAIAINPDYAEAWHWYGLMQRFSGQIDGAYEKLKRAVELDPLHPVARNNLGQALLALGKLDEASAFFERGTELEPDFPTNYLMLALIEASRPFPQPKRALAWVNAALEHGADGDALRIKTELLLYLDNVAAARETAETYLALKPDDIGAVFTAGLPLVYQGENLAAAELLEAQLAGHADDFGDKAFMINAMASALRGDHPAALAAWYRFNPALDDEAPVVEHKGIGYATLVAWSMFQTGQHARARHLLDSLEAVAVALPEFGPESRQLMDVEIAALRGDYDLALRRLEQALVDGFRSRLIHGGWTLDRYPLFAPLVGRADFQHAVATIDDYTRSLL